MFITSNSTMAIQFYISATYVGICPINDGMFIFASALPLHWDISRKGYFTVIIATSYSSLLLINLVVLILWEKRFSQALIESLSLLYFLGRGE